MSSGTLILILIAIAVLGASGIVIRNELSTHIASVTSASQSSQSATQKQAEQQSEQQAIDAACEALRKMGKTNKNCPPK